MYSKNRVVFFNIVSTIVLQGLAFFCGPIFSSLLGTSNYGIAAVYLTWVQIASTVFSLQVADSIAVARLDFPLTEQGKFQSSILSLATTSFILFSSLVLVASIFLSSVAKFDVRMIALGLLQAWGSYCVMFVNAKLTYEFKADKNFVLSVSTSVLTIALSILLIYIYPAEINYWGRIIGQSIIYGIVGLALCISVFRKGRTLYNHAYWKYTLPITIPTVFHSLAHIALNQSDRVMIQRMMDNSSVGIYALSSTFASAIMAVCRALNNSWGPFYFEYTKTDQIDAMKKHARNYAELFTLITMGFILLSREVYHLYARNKDFWTGTDFVPLFAVGYYFVFLYSFPVNFEFYNKRTKSIACGTALAAVLNIVLNYFMIMWCGAVGAVIATSVAHVFLFGFHFVIAKGINEMEFPFRLYEFAPGVIAVCCTCIIYWVTKESWIIRWTIAIAIGFYLIIKVYRRKEIF